MQSKRKVIVAAILILMQSVGFLIWGGFYPKYLQTLGATMVIIGALTTFRRILDIILTLPGGLLTDHIGKKLALSLSCIIAAAGYLIYYLTPFWIWIIPGIIMLAIAGSLSQSATMSLIADVTPHENRALGYAISSFIFRIGILFAVPLGGYLVLIFGMHEGVRLGLLINIMLILSVAVAYYLLPLGNQASRNSISAFRQKREAWQEFLTFLKNINKNLLFFAISHAIARAGSALAGTYLIFYALDIIKIDPFQFSLLTPIGVITAMISYMPAAKLSDRYGRKPFVCVTFLCLGLRPLLFAFAPNFWWLIPAAITGGLVEFGEPARKALVADFSTSETLGRVFATFIFINNLITFPMPFIGSLIWDISPMALVITSFLVSLTGLLMFILLVKEGD